MRSIVAGGLAVLAITGIVSGCDERKDDSPAKIAQLEQRIGRLEDVNAIERLIRAYGYYFDKGLWSEAASVFTDDATVEIAQRGVYKGHDSIGRLYLDIFGRGKNCLPPGGLNNHVVVQPIITVAADGQTAVGRARILGQLAVRDGDAMTQEGLYNLKFQKVDGIWRIAAMHYFGDIYLIDPGALKRMAATVSPASATVPPDAPPTIVYKSYPGSYVPEFPYVNPVTGKEVDVSACNQP